MTGGPNAAVAGAIKSPWLPNRSPFSVNRETMAYGFDEICERMAVISVGAWSPHLHIQSSDQADRKDRNLGVLMR